MAHRRNAPQVRLDGGRHGAEMALPGVELAERVADVNALDRAGVDTGVGQGGGDCLRGEVGDVAPGFRQVAGEVGLVDTEDADGTGHAVSVADVTARHP